VIYVVKHPKWVGALNALFREPGRSWENMMNSGYVTDSVAQEMVAAGIAVFDGCPPTPKSPIDSDH
jgi:hypothetical protein